MHHHHRTEDQVLQTLVEWKSYIDSNIIFYHAPGENIKAILAPKIAPKSKKKQTYKGVIAKDDIRLQKIPFTTNRPSYQEICNSFEKLTTVTIKIT